jgi:hypothetical protein
MFEGRDRVADRGHSAIQPLGCGREASRLHNGQEHPELVNGRKAGLSHHSNLLNDLANILRVFWRIGTPTLGGWPTPQRADATL